MFVIHYTIKSKYSNATDKLRELARRHLVFGKIRSSVASDLHVCPSVQDTACWPAVSVNQHIVNNSCIHRVLTNLQTM